MTKDLVCVNTKYLFSKKRGSKKAFSEKYGIRSETVSRWCNGSVYPSRSIDYICEFFNVSLFDLRYTPIENKENEQYRNPTYYNYVCKGCKFEPVHPNSSPCRSCRRITVDYYTRGGKDD